MENKWIIREHYDSPICSVCGERENEFVSNGDAYGVSNYCPSCGAKMCGSVNLEDLDRIGGCDTCAYRESGDDGLCTKCYVTAWDDRHRCIVRRMYHDYSEDIEFVGRLRGYKARYEELMARKEQDNENRNII